MKTHIRIFVLLLLSLGDANVSLKPDTNRVTDEGFDMVLTGDNIFEGKHMQKHREQFGIFLASHKKLCHLGPEGGREADRIEVERISVDPCPPTHDTQLKTIRRRTNVTDRCIIYFPNSRRSAKPQNLKYQN